MNRTTRSFPTPPNFWPIVESWAIASGYRSIQSDGGTRVFQKGRGFWVAPMMLQLHEADGTIEMEAWIRANLFVRIAALMLLPAEMGIESGGFKAVLPRKIARKAVNQLLEQLAQPPIP
jgi:hypothetical protein